LVGKGELQCEITELFIKAKNRSVLQVPFMLVRPLGGCHGCLMLPLKLVLGMLEISLDSNFTPVAVDPDIPIHSTSAKVCPVNPTPNKQPLRNLIFACTASLPEPGTGTKVDSETITQAKTS
jgi:hypothetical protein